MSPPPDLICFSHLRWDFVWQRPQHLMTRAAAGRRVWFVEEAVDGERAALTRRTVERGVQVVRPVIPAGTGRREHERQLRLMGDFILIPLSERVRQALAGAAARRGEREALLRRLRDHINNDVLTLSHGDVETIFLEWLALAE